MSEDWTVASTAPAPANPWADPHATLATVLGPGQISSARRSAARNARVGGSSTSSHLDAQAVDWIPADGNTRAAAQKLAQAGLPYDQIIDEGTHLHVGYGPKMRQQALTSVPDDGWAVASTAQDWTPVSPPPAPPRLKRNAVPVPPSLLDRAVGAVKSAGANLEANISARSKAALEGAKAGLAEINAPYDPNEDAYVPALRQAHGVMSAVGGAFSAATAPISGYAQATAGQALEKVTKGAVPKEVIGDYTDAMLGFVAPESLLTPKAKAMRAKAALKEKATPAAQETAPVAEDWTPVASEPAPVEGAPATPEREVAGGSFQTDAAKPVEAAPAASEPPVAPGMVRMYHGGNPDEAGLGPEDPLWFTSHRSNAEGYAAGRASDGTGPKAGLWYVDIPDKMRWSGEPGEGPENGFAPRTNMELPGEIASQRKLLVPPDEWKVASEEPIYYHGTRENFSQFKIPENGDDRKGPGIFFTDNKEYADSYAREGGTTHAVHLDIKNPLHVEFEHEINLNKAWAEGHDAVISGGKDENGDGWHQVVAVKNPDQIRFAAPVAEHWKVASEEPARPAAMAAEVEAPPPTAEPTLDAPAQPGEDHGPVVGAEADPVERVDNALYRLSGHKEADKAEIQQYLKAMPAEFKDPALQEELYHAIEAKIADPTAEIPDHLKPAFEAMAGPYQEQTDLINHLRELGDPEAETYGYDTGYVARRVEGHTPLFDDTEGPSRGDPILGTKPTLTNKAQAQKQRTAGFMVTDQDGAVHFTDTPDRTDIMDRPYTSVRPATTAEIEANTGTRYHKNALINTVDNVMHLRQVVRNHEVLDELKKNLIEQGLAHRDEHYFRGEDGMMNTVQANSERPEGYRQVPSVPQLKGISFAPHIAEVLEDVYNRPLPGDPVEALSKLNRALTVPMFITPVIHAQNVAVHWGIGRGFDWVRPGGMKSLLNDGASAIHQVLTLGPIYRDLIRDGMAGQFIGTQTRKFHAQLLKEAGRQIDPEMQGIFSKAVGVPWKMIKAAYDTSSKALWYANDVMLMQRVLELKRKGMSTHEAIYEAEREIPNYRIPPRVGGTKGGVSGRTASRVLQSSAIGMFNRYKYGAARAWAALAKDIAKGTPKQKAEAVGKLLVAVVVATGLYPAMDWAAQKATGNKNARFKRAGGLSMTDAAYDMATGQKDPSLASSTFFSPGPVESLGTGLVGNHDFFGRDIRTPGAPAWFQGAEAAKYLGTQGFYPARLADQAAGGHGDQAAGQLVGLQLPTDKQAQNKTKYQGLDKTHAAVAVGRFKNRVKAGKVVDAIDKMGR